jgi:hypothetical protein
MPDGLKNAGPTFYRMMKYILKGQSGKNVFIYVDNIVVASKKKCIHIKNLAKTFANTHEGQLKLNSEKFIFEVDQGEMLGCLILVKGIEENPEKSKSSCI